MQTFSSVTHGRNPTLREGNTSESESAKPAGMTRTHAKSPTASLANDLIETLQQRFVNKLHEVARAQKSDDTLKPICWLRDEGKHGGGERYVIVQSDLFDRAAVNVSGIHYDDDPNKRLSSANAISTIIHPRHPRAPSMHMHISWTEMRDGQGSWRVMADLNPSHADDEETARFASALKKASGDLYAEANAQGDRYFNIPALDRHRGVTHFYLEGYRTDDAETDRAFAQKMGEVTIDTYGDVLAAALTRADESSAQERATQLAYHTLYFFQVLTLDRGTTSGLLVHDQNDVGIMGSLPSHLDRELLASWAQKVPPPQEALVNALVAALPTGADCPAGQPCPVSEQTRAALAQVVRHHYQAHPEALNLQASGDMIPPTVANHGDR